MAFSSSKAKSASEYRRMTETPVLPLVLRLSVPTTISMLITSIYNLADTYFVSSLGNAAAGAVGVVFSIQSVIQAIGYGFGMGSQSLVSRLLGEKKKEEAELVASSGFVAAFLMGLLIMILGLIDLPLVMRLFGSTETALPLACGYGKWILIGAPVFCSSFVLNNILRGEGKAALSMAGLCSGGVINIGLDALFIYGFHMGIEGAAIATILSQFISFCILAFFFLSGRSYLEVNPKKTSRRLSDYLDIFRTGLPTVFRQSLGSVAATLLNHAVRPYGDAAMAAVSIANKIYMLLRSMLIGVGQGFQPVAGFNYGAKKYDRVTKSFNVTAVIGTIYGVLASLVLFFFAENIIGVFRAEDAEVIEIGSRMLRILSVPLIVLGYSTFVNLFYQALGYVAPATILASCRQGIFFVPLILLLPRALGLSGIRMTQALSDLITFVVSVPFHVLMVRRLKNLERAEREKENGNEDPEAAGTAQEP